MKIIFIRTAEHALYGTTTWPIDSTGLSSAGIEQSRQLASVLADRPITAICASMTVRVMETIRPLAERKGLVIQKEAAFNELDVGECAGLDHERVREVLGSVAWEEMLSNPIPDKRYFTNGETLNELAERSWAKLKQIVATSKNESDLVVIGTHEEVIGALLCKMIDAPLPRLWWWQPPYASTTEVQWRGGKWKLLHFGCAEHM